MRFCIPPLRLAALTGAAALLITAGPASAQEEGGPASAREERSWLLSIGGGPQFRPEYPGAESLGFSPMPIIDLRRSGTRLPFEAPDEGAGFGFLSDESAFDFGPAVRLQGKRQEEDVGAPVGDVGFTVEVGAFGQAYIGDRFRLRAEGRKGIGGHEGWVGDLGADFLLRDRDTYVFSIGPRARFSDDKYQNAYFGVTPGVAAATGLPVFDADGGFHAVGIVTSLNLKFDRHWGMFGYAGYDRLIGDAADSPIVRAFGSRDQFSAGLGLYYAFDIGNPF